MGNVYTSSDWHGCGQLAKKVFDFLQPDDKLFFLGDAIDRGPNGMDILKILINDPRVFFLKGNHEDMMVQCWKDCQNEDDYYWNYWNYSLWVQNDSKSTYQSFMKIPLEIRRKYVVFLSKLDKETYYINKKGQTIIMNHAGYIPNIRKKIKEGNPYFWDREHFNDSWKEHDNVILIHGHTPVQYLKFYYGYKDKPNLTEEDINAKREFFGSEGICTFKPTILTYCDRHKIDIDMCTIFSKRIALLNLDTFEEIYIDE